MMIDVLHAVVYLPPLRWTHRLPDHNQSSPVLHGRGPVLSLSRDRLFLETYTQPIRNSYPTLNGISHLSHFGKKSSKIGGVSSPCALLPECVAVRRRPARSAHCRKAESNKVVEMTFSGLPGGCWVVSGGTHTHTQGATTATDDGRGRVRK